jgi:mannose-1-phosphate guanylyltransferase
MSTLGCKVADRESLHAHPGTEASADRVALLLAGGDGMRLQDLTSEIVGTPIPKQYCRLLQGTSLLEATISRAHLVFPCERIHVIINEGHLDLARDQTKILPDSNVLVQPLNRDTGPGMVFALLHLERVHGDATVAVFPTDHYIDRNWAFIAHVLRAANAISYSPDKIGILAVVPDRPESGYGYILPAERLKKPTTAYRVQAFEEKPNPAAARELIARGGLWNTFVMIFRLSRMLELLQRMVPHEVEKLSVLRASPHKASELYQTITPWNFSTRVLSRIPQHLIAFRVANVHWSDWGTRESVERTYKALKLVPSWKMPRPIENGVLAKKPAENLLQSR